LSDAAALERPGWRWIKLGDPDFCDIVNGSTPDTENSSYWDGNIPWATPTDIGQMHGIYLTNTTRKITATGLDNCSATMLPVGTVLMTSRAPVGNIAIAGIEMCTNQGFKNLVPKRALDSLYLYFVIKHYVPVFQWLAHGNTFTELTKEKLQGVSIPAPEDVTEQIRIAEHLATRIETLSRARDAADRQLEAINALPAALLREKFGDVIWPVL
jgi:type I restriction enzyme S subunit